MLRRRLIVISSLLSLSYVCWSDALPPLGQFIAHPLWHLTQLVGSRSQQGLNCGLSSKKVGGRNLLLSFSGPAVNLLTRLQQLSALYLAHKGGTGGQSGITNTSQPFLLLATICFDAFGWEGSFL